MNLKETIKYVKEASEELRNSFGIIIISPDMILDCATRIFISENINQSKKDNIKAIQNPIRPQTQGKPITKQEPTHPFNNSSPDSITPKQQAQLVKHKEYLLEKGIDIKNIKTKKEASSTLSKLYSGEV